MIKNLFDYFPAMLEMAMYSINVLEEIPIVDVLGFESRDC